MLTPGVYLVDRTASSVRPIHTQLSSTSHTQKAELVLILSALFADTMCCPFSRIGLYEWIEAFQKKKVQL
ncbi:hypothetical protein GQ42DRAFT_163317 [Ramicandelaber brevisporus]|nr:hypothetical protein GQ42DRAFT_163317 [Ramicandelaber brevisporus]